MFLDRSINKRWGLIVDPYAYIGDILHEAGHLAIFPKRLRFLCNNSTVSSGDSMAEAVHLAGLSETENELNLLQYCYDDQAPQGWQYAANIHLGLDSNTGFTFRFAEGEGKEVHDSIQISIGSSLGHRTSVCLYYLGMVEKKKSFPTMLKWLN
jgi:hypothetical protein